MSGRAVVGYSEESCNRFLVVKGRRARAKPKLGSSQHHVLGNASQVELSATGVTDEHDHKRAPARWAAKRPVAERVCLVSESVTTTNIQG